MGCDIHLHTEVKINGVWHHYSCPSVSRSYALFSKMAGVRGNDEIEPIAELRGVPSDATELTKYDCQRWNDDGHSHSWLNAQEIYELVSWAKRDGLYGQKVDWMWEGDEFGYLFGNNWSDFAVSPHERAPGLEDIRFIFWFDN